MAEPEPTIFDDSDDEADRLAETAADADAEAGRVVPHARVREWLMTLGTPDQPAAQTRMRGALIERATSARSNPIGPEYYEALRNRVCDE